MSCLLRYTSYAYGFAQLQDELALVREIGPDEALGVRDANVEMTAESRGVDSPAVLFFDHLKMLDKTRVCRLDRDRVVFPVVIERHGLRASENLVCLCVHIDQAILIERNAKNVRAVRHLPAAKLLPFSF